MRTDTRPLTSKEGFPLACYQMAVGMGRPSKEGQQKRAILFADIADFTTFAGQIPPDELIRLLNRYFRLMGSIVQQHEGWINDYAGDRLLAVFDSADPRQACLQAVRAGTDMLEILQEFNQEVALLFEWKFAIRVGVHFGEVTVGKIGLPSMQKLAVVGDAVNIASRIEEANKPLATCMLISEQVYEQVSKYVIIHQSFELRLRGKSGLYKLVEIARYLLPIHMAEEA
jgi:adenylate cyclase